MKELSSKCNRSRKQAVTAGLLTLAWTLLAAMSAHADAFLSVSTQLCPDGNLDNCVIINDPSSASDALHVDFNGSSFDGAATASADYGVLRAYASVSLTDYEAGTYQENPGDSIPAASAGRASFNDTWEILGVPEDGGLLHLTFLAEGTISHSGFGQALAFLVLQNFSFQQLLVGGIQQAVFDIPFTSGSPLDINVALIALTSAPDATAPAIYSFAGNVDYANTVTLTDILITDSNGNPIRGAGIRAESDTTYPVSPDNNLGVIPEPATVLLLGSGLAGILALRRNRFSTPS